MAKAVLMVSLASLLFVGPALSQPLLGNLLGGLLGGNPQQSQMLPNYYNGQQFAGNNFQQPGLLGLGQLPIVGGLLNGLTGSLGLNQLPLVGELLGGPTASQGLLGGLLGGLSVGSAERPGLLRPIVRPVMQTLDSLVSGLDDALSNTMNNRQQTLYNPGTIPQYFGQSENGLFGSFNGMNGMNGFGSGMNQGGRANPATEFRPFGTQNANFFKG